MNEITFESEIKNLKTKLIHSLKENYLLQKDNYLLEKNNSVLTTCTVSWTVLTLLGNVCDMLSRFSR